MSDMTLIIVWLLVAFVLGMLLGVWLTYRYCKDTADSGSGTVTGYVPKKDAELHTESGTGAEINADPGDASSEYIPANLFSGTVTDVDDLKKVKGIGPKLETLLNSLGVYTFDQIANWQQKDIDWVDSKLAFPGRIEREEWVSQARVLAKRQKIDT